MAQTPLGVDGLGRTGQAEAPVPVEDVLPDPEESVEHQGRHPESGRVAALTAAALAAAHHQAVQAQLQGLHLGQQRLGVLLNAAAVGGVAEQPLVRQRCSEVPQLHHQTHAHVLGLPVVDAGLHAVAVRQ